MVLAQLYPGLDLDFTGTKRGRTGGSRYYKGMMTVQGGPQRYQISSDAGILGVDMDRFTNETVSELENLRGFYDRERANPNDPFYSSYGVFSPKDRNSWYSRAGRPSQTNSFEEWYNQSYKRDALGARLASGYFSPKDQRSQMLNFLKQKSDQATRQAQARKRSKSFGRRFIKPLVMAAPLAIGGLGAASALGALGSAGATGVSAGSVVPSSGGLGSLLSGVSKNALLSGALKGGIGGYLSGGDLGSALKGAGLGALGGGFGSSLGASMGLGSLGQSTLTGALTGAAGGLGAGNIKDAGLGAVLGGGGAYVMGGGNVPGLGTRAGAPLTGGMQGPTQGSGILGGITRNASSLGLGGGTSSLGGSSMMGGNNLLGSALKGGMALYGQRAQEDTNEEIRRRLMEAADRQDAYLRDAQGMFDPYQQAGMNANNQLAAALSAGFQPSDLAGDAGYKFRLQQGEQALGRQMAAAGMGQSGAALKAAQEFGQGLAAQEYQDAYNRWLSQNAQLAGLGSQGLSAAGSQAGLAQSLGATQAMRGDIDAQIMAQNEQNKQRMLSSFLPLGSALLGGLF